MSRISYIGFLWGVFYFLHLALVVDAYSSGAPPGACSDTIPQHGLPIQTGPSPYCLQAQNLGASYRVTIISSVPFKGFLLKAKTALGPDSEFIGQFSSIPTEAKYMTCGNGNQQSVTHTDGSNKQNLQFEWIPNGATATPVFQLTAVQDYSTYWTNILSTDGCVQSPSSSQSPVFTTTVPTGSIPLDPECGVTKGCFEKCEGTRCTHVITWKNGEAEIEFEIKSAVSTGDQWVAIGFSSDAVMGDDSVISCIRSSGVISIEHSNNIGKSNVPLTPDATLGLNLTSYSQQDTTMTCTFTRVKNVTGEPKIYDLNKSWRLIFAKGPVTPSGIKMIHTESPEFSASVIDFTSTDRLTGQTNEYIFVKVHGSLMLLAWILFSSVGIVTARYLKSGWNDKKMFGLKVWFQIHRFCMVTTFLCTVASFVIIFIDVGGYSEIVTTNEKEYLKSHPILGIIVTALTVINPIMALFRPGPDSGKRVIFNWSHRIVGVLAHVIAAITIFFGFELGKSGAPSETTYIMYAYVAIFVLMQIVFEVNQCCVNKTKGTVELELKSAGQEQDNNAMKEKGNNINTWILYLHILLMASFSIAIIVLILMN